MKSASERTSTISARLTPEEKRRLQLAAAHRGTKPSHFMVEAALKAAQKIIGRAGIVVLCLFLTSCEWSSWLCLIAIRGWGAK